MKKNFSRIMILAFIFLLLSVVNIIGCVDKEEMVPTSQDGCLEDIDCVSGGAYFMKCEKKNGEKFGKCVEHDPLDGFEDVDGGEEADDDDEQNDDDDEADDG